MAAGEEASTDATAEKARKFLRRGLEAHREDPRMYSALAALEARSGRREEAATAVRRGLQAIPGQVGLPC